MGVPFVFLGMFLRKKSNKSRSVSVQIISKQIGKYKVEQTIGSSSNEQELSLSKLVVCATTPLNVQLPFIGKVLGPLEKFEILPVDGSTHAPLIPLELADKLFF